jgi:nitroreductase
MLSVMQAIEKRRSVRQFRPDPVPRQVVDTMLEAARLAPSGSNRQPWRFQIVTDPSLRERIFTEATFGSKHVIEAPLIIVCGSELLSYVKGNRLAPSSSVLAAEKDDWESLKPFLADAQMNTAIAIEHMVLAATAQGVGTCWLQRIKPGQMAKLLGWPRHVVALCLLLVGYPVEEPPAKPRLTLDEIVLKST